MDAAGLSAADDGLNGVLAALMEAQWAGAKPDPEAWVARHPEFATELRDYFAALGAFGVLAAPLQQAFPRAAELPTPHGGPLDTLDDKTAAGKPFGGYDLIREIGRGGMGIVYLAREHNPPRLVALKLISSGPLAGAEERQRFRTEAEAIARLEHPNIVPVYAAGEYDGQPFFTSKLFRGGDLSQHLPRLKADPAAAGRLVRELAGAVHYAHTQGVIHRDLKPSNILMDGDGRAHVTDFGLAKVLADGQLPLTALSHVGTPGYMAPEMAGGRDEVSPVALDVYGLGAILYASLTGQPPHHGPTAQATIEHLRTQAPVPPRQLNPRVPRRLEAICLRCLERDPARRYPTAAALATDLGRALAPRRPFFALVAAFTVILGAVALTLGVLERQRTGREQTRQHQVAAQAARQKGLDACAKGEIGPGLLWLARALELTPPDDESGQRILRQEIGAYETRTAKLLFHLPHPGRVWSSQFSPDSKLILTNCLNGDVSLWDATTGKRVGAPLRPGGRIWAALFRPDGRAVWVVGENGTVTTARIETNGFVLPPTPDQNVSGRPGEPAVHLWQLLFGRLPAHPLQNPAQLWQVFCDRDRKTAVTLGYRSKPQLYLADGSPPIQLDHPNNVLDAAFSPDGQTIATAGTDQYVRFWDARAGAKGASRGFPLYHPSDVHAVTYSPNGQTVITGDQDTIRFWDAAAEMPKERLLIPHQGEIRTLAVG